MGNANQKEGAYKAAGAQPKPANTRKSKFIAKQQFGYREDDYPQRKMDTPDKIAGYKLKVNLDEQNRRLLHRPTIHKLK